METETQYRILEHINYEINCEGGERVLIIPNIDGVPNMKKVLCLSDTSLYIWRMIEDQKNCGQMIEEMGQRYHRESEELQSDLKEFLDALLANGYIFAMN